VQNSIVILKKHFFQFSFEQQKNSHHQAVDMSEVQDEIYDPIESRLIV